MRQWSLSRWVFDPSPLPETNGPKPELPVLSLPGSDAPIAPPQGGEEVGGHCIPYSGEKARHKKRKNFEELRKVLQNQKNHDFQMTFFYQQTDKQVIKTYASWHEMPGKKKIGGSRAPECLVRGAWTFRKD